MPNSGLLTTIHLVHGTWPGGILGRVRRRRGTAPQWFEKGSKFREAILASSGAQIRFVQFPWSGSNSIQAREHAAVEFRGHFARERQRNPHGVHLVIAHSHGGNVVLRALATMPPDDRTAVAGIAALATPFLLFRGASGSALQRAVRLYPVIFWPTTTAGAALVAWFNPGFPLLQVLSWGIGVGSLAAGLWILTLHTRIRSIDRRLRRWRLPSHFAPVGSRLFVVRATGDEATLVLSVAQLAARASATALGLAHRTLFLPMERLPPRLLLATYCLGLLAPLAPRFGAPDFPALHPALWLPTVVTAGIAMSLFGASLTLFPSAILQTLAFGSASPLVFFMNDVHVDSTPSGWEGPLLNVRIDRYRGARLDMYHFVHELPEVRSRLSKWIDDTVSLSTDQAAVAPHEAASADHSRP